MLPGIFVLCLLLQRKVTRLHALLFQRARAFLSGFGRTAAAAAKSVFADAALLLALLLLVISARAGNNPRPSIPGITASIGSVEAIDRLGKKDEFSFLGPGF